jgi:lipoprotein NlpI
VNEQREERTEQQIVVREVTHMQASWTEGERGAPGYFTVQLILDNGAEEYVLRPTVEDAEEIFRLRDRSGRVYFDLQRKVLMFGNLPVDAPGLAGLALRLLGGR